ncbi:MAG: hypothetical protein RQ856_06305 [Candidatus Izemoplasmatales bacterium]|nr:hypothetical protein [Candidatus Izemoplasmatales bacterium]
MKKYLLPGLVANAATLGIHWIYDYKYLETLAKKQSLLFMRQEKVHFENSQNSYYSYPNSEVGDVTIQGDILIWLYQAMKDNPNLSMKDYSKLLYQQFKPGGTYRGYVETYAKKHVITVLAKSLNLDIPEIEVMDDHLVGFVPYLVCKELGFSIEKAWELTNVYSQDKDYYRYFKMFDELFVNLPKLGLKKAIEQVIHLGPEKYQTALKKAIEMTDANDFIEQYSGRACAIKYSIPLIIHILYHTNSYEEAIIYNAPLGGAVSDRNTMIGAISAQVSKMPEGWLEKVSKLTKL